MYKNFNITLFALEIKLDGQTQVNLNPAEYILEDKISYGYVIANALPNFSQINDIELPPVERGISTSSHSNY